MPKEYKMQMTLSAVLGQQFGSTFRQAQAALQNAGADVKKLNDLQRDIAGYQAQQRAAAETERKLADLKTQYDNIQREMQETGTYSSALDNKLVDKQRQIDRTTESLDRQDSKLREMGAGLREAGIDTDHLTEESRRLAAELEEVSRKEESFGTEGVDAFEAVGDALAAAGIAAALKEIGEAYKECVELAAAFEETMSTVEALSGANAGEMRSLSDEAKRLGATTKFTATESAEAMTYMGMAGWDAQQMLSGMDGVLKLAAASGEDLAQVSDIVTDNLTAFGMKASDTARFSDVLAAASTNSNTSVSIMGETFKKAAPVAGALGYSVEDVAVAVGLMANAGVKGSRAGTALSNTFTGLLNGVTLTGAAFGEMEFTVVNTDGSMMSFGQTIDSLRAAFSQMSEAEKVANAQAIAGKQGYAGLLAILNATNDDYNKLTSSIANCAGAAEKMANIKMDNLRGQMTLLDSAADALKTTIGEAYAKEFQSLAKMATDALGWINDFLSKHPVLLKSIIAITAEAGVLVGVYTAYVAVKKIKNTLTALETKLGVKQIATTAAETAATNGATASQLKLNAAMLASPVGIVMAAVAALTVAFIALKHQEEEARAEMEEMTPVTRRQAAELQSVQREYERVSDEMGQNSTEALRLRNKLEDLNAEYAANARSMEDMRADYDNLMSKHQALQDSMKEGTTQIEAEETTALALIQRLADMAEATDGSAASQMRMKNVIDALNSSVGGLNLTYEEFMANPTAKVSDLTAYVRAMAERKKFEQDMEHLLDLMNLETELSDKSASYTGEKGQVASANSNVAIKKAQSEAKGMVLGAVFDKIMPFGKQVGNALGYVISYFDGTKAAYKAALEQEVEVVNEAVDVESALNTTRKEILAIYDEYGFTRDAVASGSDDIVGYLQSVTAEAQRLSEAYTETYNAALESISGQYHLWDEAAEVSAVSISTINTHLQGQIQYWKDYQANIDVLRGYTTEVEGLDVVLASFADGSSDSVNVIAGLADAIRNGDIESVQALVTNYNELQASQQETADSLAEMTTSYSVEMEKLKTQMGQDVAAMDFSDEAKTKGEQTIQGFIDGALLMESKIRTSFASLGQAAIDAMNGKLDIHSPSRVFAEIAGYTWQGFIGETERLRPTVAAAFGETADAGVRAVTATPAVSEGGINAPITLSITVAGNATPETASALSAAGNDIVSRVIEALEDRERDRIRRAYV